MGEEETERDVPGRPAGVGAQRCIFIAVPPDRNQNPVRLCATFTEDLQQLVDWLAGCDVTTIAMESTGVYWIPLYDILESHGLKPCLVNARHMKNVPGRRTDWHECQWLQYLHSVGLLRGAFRPEAEVTAVRTVIRHRPHELVQIDVTYTMEDEAAGEFLKRLSCHQGIKPNPFMVMPRMRGSGFGAG